MFVAEQLNAARWQKKPFQYVSFQYNEIFYPRCRRRFGDFHWQLSLLSKRWQSAFAFMSWVVLFVVWGKMNDTNFWFGREFCRIAFPFLSCCFIAVTDYSGYIKLSAILNYSVSRQWLDWRLVIWSSVLWPLLFWHLQQSFLSEVLFIFLEPTIWLEPWNRCCLKKRIEHHFLGLTSHFRPMHPPVHACDPVPKYGESQ